MKKITLSAISAAILAAPALAFADKLSSPVPSDAGQQVPAVSTGAVTGALTTISNFALGILIALAVIFIITAAFKYLTSKGDAKEVSAAKDMLIYALVAVVVGILAKGLVGVAQYFAGQL